MRADEQETPSRNADGAWVGWIDQLLPFQASANGPLALPTAVQRDAEGHDTALNWATVPGLGVVCSVQLLPFQRTACAGSSPLLFLIHPTAVHTTGDAQDTPMSPPAVARGRVWIDQLVPSQRSATIENGPPRDVPTAVHANGDMHDTPASTLSEALVGLGVLSIVQVVPFQASANVIRVWGAAV